MQKDDALKLITDHYSTSGDFNGTSFDDLGDDPESARHILRDLLLEGKIVLNFGDRHPNPHILAFDPEPPSEQIKKLEDLVFNPPKFRDYGLLKIRMNSTNCCAYPSKSHLSTVVDTSEHQGRPYTLLLALGEPQLGYRAFNLRVLEFYRNDPRYSYDTDDIHGHISTKSGDPLAPPDDIFLERFGFAYDRDLKTRYVAVFLRDLTGLTPEHQQRWKLDQVDDETFLHPDYAMATAGLWSIQESVFNAFCEELIIINEMTKKIGGVPLFRNTYGRHAKPIGFTYLIRPTKMEYEAFVHLLDKMISDNIDKKFFRGKVELTWKEDKNGVTVEQPKGTITLLAEWLAKSVKLHDNSSKDEMMKTFRDIRQERGPLAHEVQQDEWDHKYFEKQRNLVIRAYSAIRTLRQIFAIHPSAKSVTVPEWLYEGEIRPY